MKKKVRIKSLPKAQFGPAPLGLTPEQIEIFNQNQNMFGTPPQRTISVPDYMGSINTTPSITEGMIPFSQNQTQPFNAANTFNPFASATMPRMAPSVTPLLTDVDQFNEPYGPLTESNYYANVAEQYTASPEGTTFDDNNAFAPGYQGISQNKQAFSLPKGTGFLPFMGASLFGKMGRRNERNQIAGDFRNRFLSDAMYAPLPSDYSGTRGDYVTNQGLGINFRPDEAVYGQFGKIAKYGGQMKRKIKITGLPQQAYGGTQNKASVDEMYPYNSNVRRAAYSDMLDGNPDQSVRQYAEEVPREIANIEAEKGETIVKPLDNGLLGMYKIGGKRHYEGGTPLQATPNDFIFSDTKDMKIKDPAILESFGMKYKKGGFTPAKISNKFNLNDPSIQKPLNDPNADYLQKATAERMYDNYLSQLGKLALVQEGRKGFPQGAPDIAMPYMQKVGMDPSMFMPDVMTPQDASMQMGKAQWGGTWAEASRKQEQEDMQEADRLRALRNQMNFSGANRGSGVMDYANYIFDFLPSVGNYMTTGNFEPYTQTFDRYIDEGNLADTDVARYLPRIADLISSGIAPKKQVGKLSGMATQKATSAINQGLEYASKKLPSLSSLKDRTKLYKELVSKYGKSVADNIDNALDIVTPALPFAPLAGYMAIKNLTPEEQKMVEENPELLQNYETIEPVQVKAPQRDTVVADPRMERAEQEFRKAAAVPEPTVLDTSELEFYKEGGQYQTGGPVKRNLRVAKNPKTGNFGVYEIDNSGKAKLLFNTFLGKGKATPGGDTESWKGGPEQLKSYIDELQNKGVDLSNINSAKDFQSVIYNYALKNNPATIENMWSKYGTTLELNKYPDLISKLNKQGVKTTKSNQGYKLDFSGIDPNKKGEVLAMLEPLYDDSKIGTRTVSLDFNTPATETPVTAPEPQPQPQPETKQPYRGEDIQPGKVDLENTRRADPGQYYIQDLMNTGLAAADRFGVKKYSPYDATIPAPALMDPTFYDPSRELAATGEMANMVTQNLGQFAGPQALSSRASQIQGNAAKSVADTLGRYNNLNVGVANQFEQANKAIINDFNLKNALAKSNYYDKTVIGNQQYDNAKRTANARLMEQGTNAITNKAMTQVLNSMYPEYGVDPTVGGEMIFIPPTTLPDGTGRSRNNMYDNTVSNVLGIKKQLEASDPQGFGALSEEAKWDKLSKLAPRESATTRRADFDQAYLLNMMTRNRRR